MEQQTKENLIQHGVDVEDALLRFLNNEALFLKFLLRFPEDPNYQTLKDSLHQGDVQGAFTAAHTLKGVAGNLSFQHLHDLLNHQVEALRTGDLTQAKAQLPTIDQSYQDILQVISTLT